MEYPPQRQYFPPATPPQQNLTTRAAEAGKMGGVTPEIWDDILQQLQQLINENGSLRNTLEANNRQMQGIIEKKGRETSSAQKLYWDARISVLGFKAQIMKLTGERDQLFEKSREVDTTELEHELDQLKKEKISAEAVTRKFQDEMETLKRTLQQWKERENSLVQTMEREKEQMRDSYEQQIAAFQKTPPVPRPRVNVPNSEIADLKRENDDLKRENAGLKRDQSELREQVDHHSVEITELRRKNTHRSENTEGQLLALQRELEKLRVSENELRDKLRQARRTEDELNNELIDKNKQIENLKLRSPQTEPQTMDFGAGGGSGGSARLRKLLNEEAGKSKRLAEQISLKNDEVAKLTKQLSSKEIMSKELEEERDRLYTSLQQLQREKLTLQQLLEERSTIDEQEFETLKANFAQMEEIKVQLEEDYSQLQDNLSESQKDNSSLLDQLQNEKERCHQYEVNLSKVQNQLDLAKNSAESESSSWEGYMQQVEAETERLMKELNGLKETNRQLQGENQQLIAERNASVQEKATLTERYERKVKESQESLENSQMWKAQFESAQSDFMTERAMREKEAKAVDALRQNRESLQKEVDELRKRVTDQQSQLASIDPSAIRTEPHPPMAGVGSGVSPGSQRRPMERESPKTERRQQRSDEQRYNKPSPPMGGGGGGYNRPTQPPHPHQSPPMSGQHAARPNDQYPPNQFRQDHPRRHPGYDDRRPSDDYYGHHRPDEPFSRSNFNPGGGGMSTAPQPYVEFQPLHGGRSGQGRGGVNNLDAPSQNRQQSGGGELGGGHFQPPTRGAATMYNPPGRGQMQPRQNQFPPHESYQSGMTPVRRQMPPDHGVVLPGDVHNAAKPSGQCPICGLDNFATQTDLELHAAKCDKFN